MSFTRFQGNFSPVMAPFATGPAGANDHTYDFGFTTTPPVNLSLGNLVWADLDDNGVLKVMGFDRSPLYTAGWTPGDDTRETRLRRIWDPFDAQLTAELRGARLMIVGHSMAPTGPAKPAAGVTATRPATAPDRSPRSEGWPLRSHSAKSQAAPAAAVATKVLMTASEVT